MNLSKKKLNQNLSKLKEQYGVYAIKTEFGSEGTSPEEAFSLKNIAENSSVALTLKIAGCEAVRDLRDAHKIGADNIVVPMIESDYALKKFVNSADMVFDESERRDKRFGVNIETQLGYENIDKIIQSSDFSQISSVTLGRDDFTASLGLGKDDADSDIVLKIANDISKKVNASGRNFCIGGCVSPKSVDFFRNIEGLKYFETRKVVFDAQKALAVKDIQDGIVLAFEFEILWLENRRSVYGKVFPGDEKRILRLESMINEL